MEKQAPTSLDARGVAHAVKRVGLHDGGFRNIDRPPMNELLNDKVPKHARD